MYKVYSKPNCIHCVNAKNLLNLRGIEFDETVLDSPEAIEKFKAEHPGISSMPQIWNENGDYIGGHDKLKVYLGVGA